LSLLYPTHLSPFSFVCESRNLAFRSTLGTCEMLESDALCFCFSSGIVASLILSSLLLLTFVSTRQKCKNTSREELSCPIATQTKQSKVWCCSSSYVRKIKHCCFGLRTSSLTLLHVSFKLIRNQRCKGSTDIRSGQIEEHRGGACSQCVRSSLWRYCWGLSSAEFAHIECCQMAFRVKERMYTCRADESEWHFEEGRHSRV